MPKEPKLGGRKSEPKMGSQPKSQSERSAETEQELADEFGGTRQPGSGSGLVNKGDVITEHFLFSEKRTDAGSLNVTRKDLSQVVRYAAERDRIPAMHLRFDTMPDGVPGRWALIPVDVLAVMVEQGRADAALEGGE